MKKVCSVFCFFVVFAVQALSANAQELNIQNWQPVSPGDAELIGVHSTTLTPAGQYAFGLSMSFLDDPLVLVDDNGDRVSSLVDHRLETQLSVAMGIGRHFEIGGVLPIILSQRTNSIDLISSSRDTLDLGDLRLVGRYRFYSTSQNLNFGIRADLILPTATDIPYAGNTGASFHPSAVLDWRHGNILAAANLGIRVRGSTQIGDLEVGSAVTWGAGVSYALEALPLTLIGELATEWAGINSEDIPVELRAAARFPLYSKINALVGYGNGLITGYGAPDHHLFFMVSLPTQKHLQKSSQTFSDTDLCPDEEEDFDGFEDEDGCPDLDNDGDNIPDQNDKCRNHAEDVDGFQDSDGCPDPDNDFDGILDKDDRCPMEAEVINGVEDDDGCPDEGKRLVFVENTKIIIKDKLFFANNKDQILPRSEAVLNQLAKTIKRMPWLKKIRIEGHTDDRGDESSNKDLSQRRAESVRAALISKGIQSNRLVATGYSENQPIDNNSNLTGRANNRRVEFVIIEQAPPPDGWKPARGNAPNTISKPTKENN